MSRLRRPLALAALLVLVTSGCAVQRPDAAPDDSLTQQSPAAGAGAAAPAALGGFGALGGAPVGAGPLPADCVPGSGPPYEIGAIGTFGGGSVKITPGVSVSGISGSFCAVARVEPPPPDHPRAKVCTHLVAPADGIAFDPVRTELDIIPGVRSVIGKVDVVPDALSAFVCDDGTPGQIVLDTVILASAAPQLFGTACRVGPLRASVKGTFSGPLSNASATLTSGAFPVDAVQAAPPSCPQGLAQSTNTILGLPLKASLSGLTLTTHAQLYLAHYDAP